MNAKRANINSAAALIAQKLGCDVKERREDPSDKAAGFLNVEWVITKGGENAGYIRLECKNGWDVEGKSWVGEVDVLVIPDNPAAPMRNLAAGNGRLVGPVGERNGPEAIKKTRHAFVDWAQIFGESKGSGYTR